MEWDSQQLYDKLSEAMKSRANLISMRHHLRPVDGPLSVVKPSTHLVPKDYLYPSVNGVGYAMAKRFDADGNVVDGVEILSVQQSARLVKTVLSDMVLSGDLIAPHMIFDATKYDFPKMTTLDLAHGVEDAYVRDSMIVVNDKPTAFDEHDIGKALLHASTRNADTFFKYAPWSLILGGWDSHRGGVGHKLARAVTSSIVGIDAHCITASGAKSDPLDLRAVPIEGTLAAWKIKSSQAKREKQTGGKGKTKHVSKLSELGYGMIPPSLTYLGGVVCRQYEQTGHVNLTRLSRYHMGSRDQSIAARTTLALLGLLALDLAAEAVTDIRSGCEFLSVRPEYRLQSRTGDSKLGPVSTAQILDAIKLAAEATRAAGLSWHTDAVRLIPNPSLAAVLKERKRIIESGAEAEPVGAE